MGWLVGLLADTRNLSDLSSATTVHRTDRFRNSLLDPSSAVTALSGGVLIGTSLACC